MFAICHDKEPLAELEKESGKAVSLATSAAGEVSWESVQDSELSPKEGSEAKPSRKLSIKIPEWCGKWVVTMDEFADGVVGAKSKNLAGKYLHDHEAYCLLQDWMHVGALKRDQCITTA